MKIATTYNNFSRAKVDHDLGGRFDLPIYSTGADRFDNFISNFKGNAIYRAGLEDMLTFEDCAFIEFAFSQEQSYLCLFTELKVKFLTYDSGGNFGFVQSGGGDLEVVSPYTLEQAKTIQWSQNADVMKLAQADVVPYDFIRVAADDFTFTASTTTGAVFPDNPTSVQFKDGRLWYSYQTTVWGSEAGDYEEFTIPGTILDSSPIEITLADLTEKIEWMFSNERSLICGNRQNLAVINGGDINTPITAANVSVTITGSDGSNSTIPVRKDGLVFYIGRNNRNAYYFSYDLLGETFKSDDANFISYDITQGGISKLRYKKDRNDLVYTIRSDGKLLALNFNQSEKIIGWSLHETEGNVKDIATITNNEGDVQLFTLTLRDSVYYIEKLAEFVEFVPRENFFTNVEQTDNEAYNRFIAEQLKECIYLDNSQCFDDLQTIEITFDGDETITADSAVFSSGDVGKSISYKTITGYESGRFEITAFTSTTVVTVDVIQEPTTNTYSSWYLTFSTLSGLTRFNGKTVSVVADGGLLGEFEVADGEIDLNKQVTHTCVGYPYKGVIKTFSLGFAFQGKNTQITKKNISQAGLRFVTSAGGKIGSSPYKLVPIQNLGQKDLNYLPPTPMDKTKLVSYSDTSKTDKFLYIVQDKPLPFTVIAAIIEAKYGVS